MIIRLGNPQPHQFVDGAQVALDGPAVTTKQVPDDLDENGDYQYPYVVGSDPNVIARHLVQNPGQVTHMPGNAAILTVVQEWPQHGAQAPSWVEVEAQGRDADEAEDFERFLAEWWNCERGVPEDSESTHFTQPRGPGGVLYAPGESPEEG